MSEPEPPSRLQDRWADLRSDLHFLPHMNAMTVAVRECPLEVVEFVKVVPSDETVTVPSAPNVSIRDVRDFPGWSQADADQLRMWPLVGTVIEGNRVTQTCPDCSGTREIECSRCHGRGRVTCPWCFGSGDRSCSTCSGSGGQMVTRTNTNADGTTTTTTDRQTCSGCGSSGRNLCTSCMGAGWQGCGTCERTGQVTCTTCSPAGTVDTYVRRTLREQTVETRILPTALPGVQGRVVLERGWIQIRGRETETPLDAVANGAMLAHRGIGDPPARLFFIRQAGALVYTLHDDRTGHLTAAYMDGEPAPVLTLHRTVRDPAWSPEGERRKALAAVLLHLLGAAALAILSAIGQVWAGFGVAAAAWIGGFYLYRNPVRAARLAFLEARCRRHLQSATIRCQACRANLCESCLTPSIRCPECGKPASAHVTHLVEDGKWVRV